MMKRLELETQYNVNVKVGVTQRDSGEVSKLYSCQGVSRQKKLVIVKLLHTLIG